MEDTLKFSDEMFLRLRHLCDDNFITSVMDGLNIETSSDNTFEVFNYFEPSFSEANNINKINFVMCFLESGGKVIYKNSIILKKDIPNFLSLMVHEQFITNEEELEISLKWTDCTYGEPYFSL